MFLTNKTVVFGKTESPAYVAATMESGMADADFNVRVKEISYSFDIAEYRRKLADGTLDFSESVMGKQQATISFNVGLAPAPSVASDPQWTKLLEACGFKKTAHSTTGISWVPHADNTHVPITLMIEEIEEGADPDGLKIVIGGAMGNVKFSVGTVGEPVIMQFEFTGKLYVVEDFASGARIDPTTFSTIVEPPLLCATATINSIAQDFDTFEFDMANDIQIWTDPSDCTGIKGAYVAGREPQMTLDPTCKLLATEDWYGDLTNSTPAPRAISAALAVSPAMTLSAPKGQLVAVTPGERNGARTVEKTLLLEKDSGNDVFEVLQGSKT